MSLMLRTVSTHYQEEKNCVAKPFEDYLIISPSQCNIFQEVKAKIGKVITNSHANGFPCKSDIPARPYSQVT
jgi:hypothetical protein